MNFITPQPLRAVGVLFSPMASRWAGEQSGGRQEKVFLGCISLVRICRCATSWSDLDLTFDLAVVTLSLKILAGLYLRNCKV